MRAKCHKYKTNNKEDMNIFGFDISRREVGSTPTATPASGNDNDIAGIDYSRRVKSVWNDDTALTVSAYYRAVDIISSSIATMPVEVLARPTYYNGFTLATNPRARRMYQLWNVRPNGRMNAYQFKKAIVIQTMNRGNAYVYPVQGGDGMTKELVLLSPVAAIQDDPRKKVVSFYDPVNNVSRSEVPYSEMYIFRNTFVDAEGKGISTISYAAKTLTISRTYNEETLNRVASGGRTKGIIKNMTNGTARGVAQYNNNQLSDARDNIQKQINEGADIITVAGDVEFIQNSLSAQDLQFIESEKFGVAEVARFTGCDLAFLMDSTNANYKTMADATSNLYARTLMPRVADIETELTAKCVTERNVMLEKIRLNPMALYAYDINALASWNKSRIETGVACPNELRAEQNLPPVEGGQYHYVSTNLAVVGSDKLTGGSGTPSPTNEEGGNEE